VLDRLARGLRGLIYVHRPESLDPLAHLDLLAESRGSELGR
jgi:hypothetical protein